MYPKDLKFKKIFQSIFVAFTCINLPFEILKADEVEPISQNCNYFGDARIEIGYAGGKFIGIERDYAEYGLFLPTSLNQSILFFDGRAYQFRNTQCHHHRPRWAASIGAGVRMCDFCDRILGVNLYYDYLEKRHTKGFDRIGLGFEWLGDCWDLRINGYLPLGSERHFGKKVVFKYPGNYKSKCQEKELAISKGFDAEFGAPLWCCGIIRIYGALGPYFYRREHKFEDRKDFWGGYAYLELNLRDYFSLQVRTSYDRVYHSHTQVRALLSIPFEALCSWQCFGEYCQSICVQPVRRNGLIFTNHCCNSRQNW